MFLIQILVWHNSIEPEQKKKNAQELRCEK